MIPPVPADVLDVEAVRAKVRVALDEMIQRNRPENWLPSGPGV